MHQFKRYGLAAGLATLLAWGLAGCGGGSDGNQKLRVSYSSLISFGDSLSDVGTFKVGTVAALGGGKYTVNSASDKNWTELIAAQLGLSAPCAAQTGLDGDARLGFSVPVANFSNCFNYAQGGSRVTDPVGPANKLLAPDPSAALGQLTVPILGQITTHLAKVNGKFSGTELVTVMAGANDLFMNLGAVGAGAIDTTQAVTAMGVAGAEMAVYIKTLLVANGAKSIVVLNIPDVKGTPFGQSTDANTQYLINLMVTTFNTQLQTGLQGSSGVLLIDAYTASKDEVENPTRYGLTNTTSPACNLAGPGNPLGSSLVCNASNINAGDVSRYLFADSVHLTPYGYQLMAQLVAKELVLAKWF
jgi:phospholipase/lecithinase/hemolysin